MKKFIVLLGLAMSLSGLTTMQAQMKIYNNLVKFGNVNTAPTLSSGLEVDMDYFKFDGLKAQFNLNGYMLELRGDLSVIPSNVPSAPAVDNLPGNPLFNTASIFITGPKDKVAIGSATKPLHSLYATDLFSLSGGSVSAFSDLRYKTDIENLAPSADKIMRLRPVKFNYREEKDGERSTNPRRLNRVGLIAQELQEVIPEAVYYLEQEDVYTVDYTLLIPFLIKAMQEQQAQVEEQQRQIEDLQALVAEGNANPSSPVFNSVHPKDAPAEAVQAAANRLYSNVPNPFRQATRIRYALTDDIWEAQLCIYDLSGQQLACHRLIDRGESEFTLRAASLKPGIYLYSLIADGKVIDTHRMVVTE